jgi:acyl-CoA thioester hydrolase
MPPGHSHQFTVRWSDLDANRHVKNTVYSEFATHTRLQLLASKGFDQARFERERFGPVMFREDVRYRRELRFGDEVVVHVVVSGLAEDGSQWRFEHEVKRGDGTLSATMLIEGAWIHLDERKLIAPPAELLDLMQGLPRAERFEVLGSVIRRAGAPG